jgi:hypothetical protein
LETEPKDLAKLMALNVLMYNSRHVREGVGNDLLQLSHSFDLEGTERTGKPILHSLPQSSYEVLLT